MIISKKNNGIFQVKINLTGLNLSPLQSKEKMFVHVDMYIEK